MNIKLNKDFETEYPNDVWKGFDGRQVATLGVAAVLGGGLIVLIWWKTKIDPSYCVYLAMPFIAGVLFLGFKQYQGMYLEEYLKELWYEKKTKHLSYDAGEFSYDDARKFSMNTKSTISTKSTKSKRNGGKKK